MMQPFPVSFHFSLDADDMANPLATPHESMDAFPEAIYKILTDDHSTTSNTFRSRDASQEAIYLILTDDHSTASNTLRSIDASQEAIYLILTDDRYTASNTFESKDVLHHTQQLTFPRHDSLGHDGDQFEEFLIHTLPIDRRAVVDGDSFSVYVDVLENQREFESIPNKVWLAFVQRIQKRAVRKFSEADSLHEIMIKEGYRVLKNEDGIETLAKKYRIRLKGIDAPEGGMEFDDESRDALASMIAGRRVYIDITDRDVYGRRVGDVYCEGLLVQERMLKEGFAWHYVACDPRPEFAAWQREARAARRGLWASPNPEKPWIYRKHKRAG